MHDAMNRKKRVPRLNRLIALVAFSLCSLNASAVEITAANCGGAAFAVVHATTGQPAVNTFELSGSVVNAPHEKKKLHKSDLGGWFHASCLNGQGNRPLLVFQEYCSGAGCVEDRYGIVDPATLKLLLVPGKKNAGNADAASRVLGHKVPHLLHDKSAFCCQEDSAAETKAK